MGHVGGTRGSGIVSSASDVLWMSLGCEELVEYVRCVCVGEEGGERIGFGLYQSCGNIGSVGRVFWLLWCRWGVGRRLGPGSGGVVFCLCEV